MIVTLPCRRPLPADAINSLQRVDYNPSTVVVTLQPRPTQTSWPPAPGRPSGLARRVDADGGDGRFSPRLPRFFLAATAWPPATQPARRSAAPHAPTPADGHTRFWSGLVPSPTPPA